MIIYKRKKGACFLLEKIRDFGKKGVIFVTEFVKKGVKLGTWNMNTCPFGRQVGGLG